MARKENREEKHLEDAQHTHTDTNEQKIQSYTSKFSKPQPS